MLQPKYIAFTMISASGLLSLLVAYSIAMLFFQDQSDGMGIEPELSRTVLVVQNWQQDIPHWQLFGIAPVKEGSDVPESRSRLDLQGIFYGRDSQKSHVIIAMEHGPGKVYRLGDHIDNGMTIHEILPNQVTLARDGMLEKLLLPQRTLDIGKAPTSLQLKALS